MKSQVTVAQLVKKFPLLLWKPKVYYHIRFEVLTAVKMSILVFWDVTPRRLVGGYHRFGGTNCLHVQP
jgi:hypothetical protein